MCPCINVYIYCLGFGYDTPTVPTTPLGALGSSEPGQPVYSLIDPTRIRRQYASQQVYVYPPGYLKTSCSPHPVQDPADEEQEAS